MPTVTNISPDILHFPSVDLVLGPGVSAEVDDETAVYLDTNLNINVAASPQPPAPEPGGTAAAASEVQA
jgi:hypothetical protein